MVLDDILEQKRVAVARRKSERSLASLSEGISPSSRSLADALSKPATGFILECKKASPSQGVIRPDFDPAALARAYAPVADAISVLTDRPYFGGRHAYLRAVSEAADLPVLCKDFVVDPYQLYEARHFGADAVLLMLSVLDDDQMRRCMDVAARLRLDCLCEVHDEAELRRALELGCAIIGINNRDLRTLEVDLTTTERLAPGVPDDRIVVCESGLSDHRDVVRLRRHADAFLVGSAMMRRPDVGRAARQLAYGRVKVCGLTRPADAQAAERAGATWGGLIFADASPRRVTYQQARAVRESCRLDLVGVYVDQSLDDIVRDVRAFDLAAVQLHGDETNDTIFELRRRLKALDGGRRVEIWKALRVRDELPRLASWHADRVVLDTFERGKRGGTGHSFDWSLLSDAELGERVIVSGGLRPDNAARADRLGAWALDVNSGVEEAPGQKDHDELEAFFARLRGGRANG